MDRHGCSFRVKDGLLLLANPRVRLGLHASNGGLALLENLPTGSSHVTRPALASLFRIRYLLPSELWVDAESFTLELARYNILDGQDGGKSLTLEYEGIRLPGSLGLLGDVTVTVALRPADEELSFSIEVHNKGEGTVQEVWFPLIRGIEGIGSDRSRDTLVIPDRSGERITDPLSTFGHHGDCIHIHYPKRASMQWMDLCSATEGTYLASYDKGLECLPALHAEKEFVDGTPSLLMSIVAYPFAVSGKRWRSPERGLALHAGDWHWGADHYRAWAATWIGKSALPGWLVDSNGLAIAIAMHQNGPVHRRFSDLPGFFAEAQKLGVNMLYLVGWSGKGLDTLYPEYAPAPELGGEQGLREAIARIRAMGGHTLLYFQFRLMDVASHYYGEGGRRWAMKSAAPSPRPVRFVDIGEREWTEEYRWPNRPREVGKFALPCPFVKEWRDLLIQEVVKAARDLGADGAYFDQLCSTTALFCHDGTHGHSTPASHWAEGHRRFLKELASSLKEVRTDFCIAGEGTNDIMGEEVHFFQGTVGPVIGESYPELFRYTFPWHRIMQTGGNNEDDLTKAFITSRLFVAGRQPEVGGWSKEDPPEYLKLFRELADLKKAKGEYFHRGRFMDDVGLAVLPGGDGAGTATDGILAKWHLAEDSAGALVCAWNRTDVHRSVLVSLALTKLSGELQLAAARLLTVVALYPQNARIEGPKAKGEWSDRDVEAGIALNIPARTLVVFELR